LSQPAEVRHGSNYLSGFSLGPVASLDYLFFFSYAPKPVQEILRTTAGVFEALHIPFEIGKGFCEGVKRVYFGLCYFDLLVAEEATHSSKDDAIAG
jgi:hypothetical protein